jgi:hypothetical protein
MKEEMSKTDPHREGKERLRVSKKNLEDKLPNPSILNELHLWDTTLSDGLEDEYDSWYNDTTL